MSAHNLPTELNEAALTVTRKVGIPLESIRELTTGALLNIAGNGGILATDTTPILNTINGDTDGAFRIQWAATNVDAIGFQTSLPDINTDYPVLIKLRAASAGATDAPVFSADSYFNEGDTKVEDDSDATSATYGDKTITIAAADIPAAARTLSVELTPGAHTTDALYLTNVEVWYTADVTFGSTENFLS